MVVILIVVVAIVALAMMGGVLVLRRRRQKAKALETQAVTFTTDADGKKSQDVVSHMEVVSHTHDGFSDTLQEMADGMSQTGTDPTLWFEDLPLNTDPEEQKDMLSALESELAKWVFPSAKLDWDFQNALGQGGFGIVFKVRVIDDDQDGDGGLVIAGKRMDSYGGTQMRRELEKQMRREFRALRKLMHPNIVRPPSFTTSFTRTLLIMSPPALSVCAGPYDRRRA